MSLTNHSPLPAHRPALWAPTTLLRLPPEIKSMILGNLDPDDLARVERVCKDLNAYAADPSPWCDILARISGDEPLPVSRKDARAFLQVVYRPPGCDVCGETYNSYMYFLVGRRLCRNHWNAETVGSTELRKRVLDIMGRKPSGMGVYPPSITDEFVSIIKRVFPLYEKVRPDQGRWSIPAIRILWDKIKRVTNYTLHNACADDCTNGAHLALKKLYGEYEVRGKRRAQLAKIADSWSKKVGFEAGIDDPELKKAFIKARKQARREAFRQRLEKDGHDAQDIEVVLDMYLASSTRYKTLEAYELCEHLPALEGMLRDLRTPRIQFYRPIRVGIAARAILTYYYARHDLLHSQNQALHQFIQTVPYVYWHRNITSLIHEDRRDTPEDRQNLHDAVTRLLTDYPGVSAYVLAQAIPPPAAPTPTTSHVPHQSISSPAAPVASQVSASIPVASQASLSHLPVQFRRSALGGPPRGPSQSS